ncbi:MAG: glutathione S-transferase family protein [Alphaproteobacteria bacterium]|nr:glutathione S-transferase family protein [Alphaproteobacteria bacterium]
MLLYEHPLSSYAQKVKIALREKGLAFEVETPAALGSGTAAGSFAAASPRNEVPALIDGEARIFDSTIILEYLEDKFPTPPLLPRDPAARAEARMIEDVCDTLYEAINWGLSEIRWFKRAEGEQAERMRATATRQTAELQAWLTEKLGGRDWFNGASFGWADLSVAPYVNRSFHYGLGTPDGSPLARWHGRRLGAPRLGSDPPRVPRSPPGMDDEVGRRADRSRRPRQEQYPLHLAPGLASHAQERRTNPHHPCRQPAAQPGAERPSDPRRGG